MRLPDDLTTEQNNVLLACLRLFAAHGRALREEEKQKGLERTQVKSFSIEAVKTKRGSRSKSKRTK